MEAFTNEDDRLLARCTSSVATRDSSISASDEKRGRKQSSSSLYGLELLPPGSAQYTPGVRQFSAPRWESDGHEGHHEPFADSSSSRGHWDQRRKDRTPEPTRPNKSVCSSDMNRSLDQRRNVSYCERDVEIGALGNLEDDFWEDESLRLGESDWLYKGHESELVHKSSDEACGRNRHFETEIRRIERRRSGKEGGARSKLSTSVEEGKPGKDLRTERKDCGGSPRDSGGSEDDADSEATHKLLTHEEHEVHERLQMRELEGKRVTDSGRAVDEAVERGFLDLSDMRSFLVRPIMKGFGVVQCYIERSKTGFTNLHPIYNLYMKEGSRHLLSAKKREKNTTSNYIISMDATDLDRSGENFIGKLRSNFVGTEFMIYDAGINPKNADPDELAMDSSKVRREFGAILYSSNVLGSRGPRKMKVCIPAVADDGKLEEWRPLRKRDEMISKFKEKDFTGYSYLTNKKPRWNDQVGAYVLNFNGRVTMASVKNFQLVSPDDQETVILQFGRVGRDSFTMDFCCPLSPLQAFAICLSSFDSKLACE